MAAAKALLSATGLLKPNTKRPKKSTATEHATSSSQPDPAASTDDVSRLPLTGLQGSASDDGFLLGDSDLEKTVALLLWMAQDFQSNIHRLSRLSLCDGPATEQATTCDCEGQHTENVSHKIRKVSEHVRGSGMASSIRRVYVQRLRTESRQTTKSWTTKALPLPRDPRRVGIQPGSGQRRSTYSRGLLQSTLAIPPEHSRVHGHLPRWGAEEDMWEGAAPKWRIDIQALCGAKAEHFE